jgi:hypothetical protein
MSEWIKMTRAQLDKLPRHLSYKPKIEIKGLDLIVSYEKDCTCNSDQIESDMASVVFKIEPDGTETQLKSRAYKKYPGGRIERDSWDWLYGYDRR